MAALLKTSSFLGQWAAGVPGPALTTALLVSKASPSMPCSFSPLLCPLPRMGTRGRASEGSSHSRVHPLFVSLSSSSCSEVWVND